VQLIAYERTDGSWDLFLFEPVGVCPPGWEEQRADPQHLRFGVLSSPERIEDAVSLVHAQLGPDYEPVRAFRELHPGARGGVNARLHRLHHGGATGYAARLGPDGHWELWARRKDLPLIGTAG
jgi:hypothetical protein